MKKVIFCFLFLFVSFFLSIQMYGQSDSLKANVNLSDEVVKKLNNNEIVDIIKYKEKLAFDQQMAEQAKVPIDFAPNTFGISVWIFLTFSFVLLTFFMPFYFNHKKIKGRQLIINNLIEKGKDIPMELLAPASKSGHTDLHRGIILIALGISVAIVLLSVKVPNNYWTIGLIPLLIGAGYLISFKFDNPNKKNSETE